MMSAVIDQPELDDRHTPAELLGILDLLIAVQYNREVPDQMRHTALDVARRLLSTYRKSLAGEELIDHRAQMQVTAANFRNVFPGHELSLQFEASKD